MSNLSHRRRLMSEGVSIRELNLESQETPGFVMRVVMREIEPRKIVTIVQQPGQTHATLETVLLEENPFQYNFALCKYAPPAEHETLDSTVEYLTNVADDPEQPFNELAQTALQHLASVTEVTL